MLKKRIKYTDYNGVEREEDFYFNFNKAEVAEMELTTEGGLEEHLRRIVDTTDGPALMELFKKLVLDSYGEKSPDGKHFIKSEELSLRFSQTEAYPELFMELTHNTEAAVEFVNGIIPKFEPKEESK